MTAVQIEFDVEMKTQDGTILRSDIFRPASGEPVPAIICRTPYNKVVRRSHFQHFPSSFAAEHGFAVVWQDVRGRFASEGAFSVLNTEIETADGCDSIEWVADQPWCDGNVGMMGVSYESWLMFCAAAAAPESLKAFAPIGSGQNRPGVLTLSLIVGWAASTAEDWLAKADLPPATRDEYAAILSYAEAHPVDSAYHLPLSEHPLALMPMMGQAFLALLAETNEGSTSGQAYEHITAPALFTTNYYDDVLVTGIEQYVRMRTGAATERAREETRLILGPWDHGNIYPMVGQANFGLHAYGLSGSAFVKQMHLDFFARHLRGEDAPELPGAKYFVIGPNTWSEASVWPPPSAESVPVYLRSGGHAASAAGDGTLSLEAPAAEEPPDRYEYDPGNPVPAFGGRFMALTGCPNGALDQAPIERRADVLVYTSAPLTEPLEIAGNVTLQLHIATDAPETDFVAKLCEVDNAGVSLNFADGIVRTSWRGEPDVRATPLDPGEVYELTIEMGPLAIVVPTGHRVRLQIASSAFPYYDRNMNTGNPIGEDATGTVATQNVFHSGALPSHLVLPVAGSAKGLPR